MFELISDKKPAGDQPKAIDELVASLEEGERHQTLLGVTGSGKSVTGDTHVLLRRGGVAWAGTIGEIIDRSMRENPSAVLSIGETELLQEGEGDIETWSFSPESGETSWKKVTQMTRHRAPDILYRVVTDAGKEVTVTGDHSIYHLRDGQLLLSPTTEVRVGDYVPVPRTTGIAQPRLGEVEIADDLVSGSARTYYVDLPLSGRAGTGDQNLLISGRIGLKVGTRQKVTDRFLRMLGYFVAEGHAEKNYVIISTADIEVKHDIINEFASRGVKVAHRKGTYDYCAYSGIWADALRGWIGARAGEKRLPPFWASLSDEQLGVLLSAYFSGDGGVDRREVTASTMSRRLAHDVVAALARLGIQGRVRQKAVAVPGSRRRSKHHVVAVAGRENLLAFQARIGFTIPRKTIRLGEIIAACGNTNVDVIPLDGNALRKAREDSGMRQVDLAERCGISRSAVSLIESGKRRPSVGVARAMAAALRDSGMTGYAREIERLCRLAWQPIRSIEKVPGSGFVYDFAVADNESFLANGVFVHNTFTMANVIARTQRPTLVMAHNKTLAAQLASELRELFPRNAVEYFVSYYDYYQPEAYVPTSDTYIGKEAMINEEIDKLRHAATAALLTRKDVIVVASVSCIYGLGAPEEYAKNIIHFRSGMAVDRSELMRKLVTLQFNRTNADLTRGTFRLRGDNWEIMPTDRELVYNFSLVDGIVGDIYEYDPVEGFRPGITQTIPEVFIAPARHFITEPEQRARGIKAIELELAEQLKKFEQEGKLLEAERLERRTRFDLAMIKEVGYAHGIENYSQPLSGRMPGEPPSTLLDYFPEGFLTVIDESHVTVPQIQGMQAGDRSRKQTLVEFGFRLPSAMDNRPLTFDEFEARVGQTIYTSATPGPFERKVSTKVVEQVIRPTGLLDPVITIRPIAGQIDDLIARATDIVAKKERVLVTTLTKRMAEDLAQFLSEKGIRVAYLHSDVKTLERIKILSDLRKGSFDVLVGVNLLREGLDLPEVSLVAILDADKEGFLRSETALVQTIGRAARNVAGEVVLYADVMTNSLTRAVDETNRRREIQLAYNKEHGITPKTVMRAINDILPAEAEAALSIELTAVGKSKKDLERLIKQKEREMKQASNDLEFELAAILRDEIRQLKEQEKGASDETESEKKGVEHYKSKADVPKAIRGRKRAL